MADKAVIDEEFITTKDDFLRVFKKVGLRKGVHVIMHSSLRKFGYIVNGANDIIDALFDVVGPAGTVLVSTNTGQLTDPKDWKNPSVPKKSVDLIRKNMRCFDKRTTPIHRRGILPESFLYYDNVERSLHPLRSIAARGELASYFTELHPLHESEGIGSPLYKLYKSGGYALLLGVNLDSCSVLHVAEYLANVPYLYEDNCNVLIKNENAKGKFIQLKRDVIAAHYKHYFPKLEHTLIDKGYMNVIEFRNIPIRLLNIFPTVNYIIDVLEKDPKFLMKP